MKKNLDYFAIENSYLLNKLSIFPNTPATEQSNTHEQSLLHPAVRQASDGRYRTRKESNQSDRVETGRVAAACSRHRDSQAEHVCGQPEHDQPRETRQQSRAGPHEGTAVDQREPTRPGESAQHFQAT